ncbi:MAG: HAD family phosphatase [Clostridium sp.]|nr:HAD family phosphatase [Clostridium sp.]
MQNGKKNVMMSMAALFDLDGVVFDTEPQYSEFWGGIGREFRPDVPDFDRKIKGQTLVQIYGRWFAGEEGLQREITARLNAFERDMRYDYIPGVEDFLHDLAGAGVFTAVVTSSNRAKMERVYAARPEFGQRFSRILTSEDFAESKPHPDCYLKGASAAGLPPGRCVVFEDSFHGIESGCRAGMTVVGLSTTNPTGAIAPFCRLVIPDFTGFKVENMHDLLRESEK